MTRQEIKQSKSRIAMQPTPKYMPYSDMESITESRSDMPKHLMLQEKRDIWALGLTLYEALTGKKGRTEMEEGLSIKQPVVQASDLTRWEADLIEVDIPDSYRKEILRMLDPDPLTRPSAEELSKLLDVHVHTNPLYESKWQNNPLAS